MRGKYLRGFGHLALAGLLIAGSLTLFCGTPAQAQRRVVVVRTYRPFYRPWRGYRPFGYDPYFDYYSRYGQYVFNSSDAAYSHGYEDRSQRRQTWSQLRSPKVALLRGSRFRQLWRGL